MLHFDSSVAYMPCDTHCGNGFYLLAVEQQRLSDESADMSRTFVPENASELDILGASL